jgi:hypothetical protein
LHAEGLGGVLQGAGGGVNCFTKQLKRTSNMGIVRKSFLLNRLGIPISKSEGRNVVANMRELIILSEQGPWRYMVIMFYAVIE